MAVDFEFKSKYNVDDLLSIMRILREPGGCPWDMEQTHESIKKNFIEETYEVVEAIDKKDKELLCEELGDVLMQVVFHAEMERENGSFDFSDVADGVCKKLIERHPHVFGDTEVSSTDEVFSNWDAIKSKSKKRKTVTDKMLSVPRELPALMRAQKLQEKASKVGFDWPDVSGAIDKIDEESAEFKAAVKNGDSENAFEELGDLLFSAVNAARFISVDAEEALTRSSDKFLSRFATVERLAKERNINMEKSSVTELDKLWDEAKLNSAFCSHAEGEATDK